MSKAEQTPPFKMQVDGLKLVPAAAWDAERLSTYRNGSTVNVVITQEKAGWRQRKYWAILNAVVKTCPVRQRRAEDLHKAIRLKLGVVDSFTTFGGATKVELRSTTSMGEQEFEAFYHEAMDLLRAETGVDVETLNKESADVGRDEQEQPEVAPHHDAGSGGSAEGYVSDDGGAPVDQSAAADPAPKETASPPAESSGADTIAMMRECLTKFIGVVTDKAVPNKKDRQDILVIAKDEWKKALPTRLDFVKACTAQMNKVLKGEVSVEQARTYLEGLIR